jgi:hypothetical protein
MKITQDPFRNSVTIVEIDPKDYPRADRSKSGRDLLAQLIHEAESENDAAASGNG